MPCNVDSSAMHSGAQRSAPSPSVVRSVSTAAAACGSPSRSSSDCSTASSTTARAGLDLLVGGGLSAGSAQ